MNGDILRRLEKIETYFGDGGACPVCRDWPALRFTTSDATTGQETGENRPAECPRCGKRTPATLDIVGMDFDDLP